jgi:hypothetical protein|nr:MAG TPA: hypothetical protein [Bacteriophage sp.]
MDLFRLLTAVITLLGMIIAAGLIMFLIALILDYMPYIMLIAVSIFSVYMIYLTLGD